MGEDQGRRFPLGDLSRVPAEVLREIVTDAPLGIVLTGPDGRYRFVNSGAITTLGSPSGPVIGRTKRDLFDDDIATVLDAMEARVRSGHGHERQVVAVDTPRGLRHYAFHKYMVGPTEPPNGDGDGNVDGAGTICTFVYDLTGVRELETALDRTQGILERLLTRSPVGMVAVEHARPDRPLYVSPNTERLLGYVGGEQPFTVGWILAQVHPDDVEETEAFLAQLRDDRDEPHRCRFRFRHADGEYRWIRASSEPLIERGRVTGVVAFLMDTTAWDQAEESRRRLEGRLRRVERFESLGQLAGGLAHDFNNLLAVIGNYVQVVDASVRRHAREATPLAGDAVETLLGDLAQIDRARDTAAALTRQLLLFGRRESALPSLFDLNDAIREAQDMLTRAVGERIAVDFQLASTPLPVLCDSGRLAGVVLNLVVNAAQAMPDGGSLVLATRRVQVDDTDGGHDVLGEGEHVELTVSDTGIGMTPEVRARAFEPFFTTKGGQGSGLGLASVLAVVADFGGDVELDSEPGVGTRVRIMVPTHRDPG